ncbi:NAD-dependent epimerase/dehydratase family protein [Streptomyces nogalater]
MAGGNWYVAALLAAGCALVCLSGRHSGAADGSRRTEDADVTENEGTVRKMSDICVIGGTRFFGKLLVHKLLADGHRVTLVNRGQTPDPFGDAVRRLRADVNVPGELTAAVAGERFDAVIHQMCYTPNAAVEVCEAFGERAGKIVMTSTIEVYNKDTFRWRFPAPPFGARAREEELDPADYDFDTTLPWDAPATWTPTTARASARPRPR